MFSTRSRGVAWTGKKCWRRARLAASDRGCQPPSCWRADSSARFIGRSLSEWLEVQARFVVGGNGRRLFATPAWCPSISTARRRSAPSSDCNLCALGDPVVCPFTLDGAPTRHLEGPRVFLGVHNVNIFFALFALVSLGVAVASPPEQLSDFALTIRIPFFADTVFRSKRSPR